MAINHCICAYCIVCSFGFIPKRSGCFHFTTPRHHFGLPAENNNSENYMTGCIKMTARLFGCIVPHWANSNRANHYWKPSDTIILTTLFYLLFSPPPDMRSERMIRWLTISVISPWTDLIQQTNF